MSFFKQKPEKNGSSQIDWPHGDGMVADWIESNATFFPDQIATQDFSSNRRHTYLQMHERVAGIAGMMVGLGAQKGDRICVLAMNSTDLLDIQFACWRIGAIFVPINWRLSAEEVRFVLDDSDPHIVFHDVVLEQLASGAKVGSTVDHWIQLDGLGGDTEFEKGLASASPIWSMVELQPEDLGLIMYSSGTTGRPKGVTFTHAMLLFAVINTASDLLSSRDMVALCAMPLFHIGGMFGFSMQCMYFGGTSIIMRAFDPGETLNSINDPELAVTHYLGVPALYGAMWQHPERENTDFSRLRCTLVGGDVVTQTLVKAWMSVGVILQEVFGMTETTASATILPRKDIPEKVGSAGIRLRHCQVKIVRVSDLKDASPGELGEIWMKGANITKSYWNRPEANEECFVDGWFRSGDIGKMDEQGYLYVEGRLKDMYISGGENVYPAEVENLIASAGLFTEFCIIGVPDSKWGEVGCVVGVPASGKTVDLNSVVEHCDGRLARFKMPAHYWEVEALPRNASGKVLKFELRQSAEGNIDLK